MHADALSVLWRVGDEDVSLDPGTYLYSEGAGWRAWLRGTAAHSCVVVDGRDQADVRSQRFGIARRAPGALAPLRRRRDASARRRRHPARRRPARAAATRLGAPAGSSRSATTCSATARTASRPGCSFRARRGEVDRATSALPRAPERPRARRRRFRAPPSAIERAASRSRCRTRGPAGLRRDMERACAGTALQTWTPEPAPPPPRTRDGPAARQARRGGHAGAVDDPRRRRLRVHVGRQGVRFEARRRACERGPR